MVQHAADSVHVEERWLAHPQGRLFTRRWAPADAAADARAASSQRSPIVLFHDSLGAVELWREFPSLLAIATGRAVIAYDRLGFGRSDPRVGRPSLDFVAEEAAIYFPAVLEQLGLNRFVALGHSVGGGMAIHSAVRFQQRCEALITIASQVFAEDHTLDGIRAAREQFRDAQQIQRLARYHGEKARWVLEAWTECWLDPAFAHWSVAGVLPKVRCPVLAIHGDRDEYASGVHPRMIGELSGGGAQVELLADTGHVPHRERPELVLSLIAKFLHDVSAVMPDSMRHPRGG